MFNVFPAGLASLGANPHQLSFIYPKQPALFDVGDEPLKLYPVEDKGLHILLDLNYTLVNDSKEKIRMGSVPYREKILRENYNLDLIRLIEEHTVLLVTVRKMHYRDITLATIERKCGGWMPDAHFFNPTDSHYGNIVKEEYLLNRIFPKFGKPTETRYFGLESLEAARRMYRRHGIRSMRAATALKLGKLPMK